MCRFVPASLADVANAKTSVGGAATAAAVARRGGDAVKVTEPPLTFFTFKLECIVHRPFHLGNNGGHVLLSYKLLRRLLLTTQFLPDDDSFSDIFLLLTAQAIPSAHGSGDLFSGRTALASLSQCAPPIRGPSVPPDTHSTSFRRLFARRRAAAHTTAAAPLRAVSFHRLRASNY